MKSLLKSNSSLFGFIAFVMISVLLTSCGKENILPPDEFPPETELMQTLTSFKQNFQTEFDNLDFDYLLSGADYGNDLYFEIPVMEDGKMQGKFIQYNKDEAFYMELKNYTEHIILYDINDPSSYEVVETVYDQKNNTYTLKENVVQRGRIARWLCFAGCSVLYGIATTIDGPLPFTDALLAGAYMSCVNGCMDL